MSCTRPSKDPLADAQAKCNEILWRLDREPMNLQILKSQVADLATVLAGIAAWLRNGRQAHSGNNAAETRELRKDRGGS